jgi:hypothetical protein
MIHASPAKPEDAFELNLRDEDAREVSPGWREALAITIAAEEAVAYRDREGNLLALYGLCVFSNEASPWLLCSPLVERHKATVWRRAKRLMRALQAHRGDRLIYNFIPKDSHGNRRFVQALGFRILPSPRDGFDLFYLPCANPQPSR